MVCEAALQVLKDPCASRNFQIAAINEVREDILDKPDQLNEFDKFVQLFNRASAWPVTKDTIRDVAKELSRIEKTYESCKFMISVIINACRRSVAWINHGQGHKFTQPTLSEAAQEVLALLQS